MQDWRRVIGLSARYLIPAVIALGMLVELHGANDGGYAFASAMLYSILTIGMIALCGWVVFLWDIDRLFYRLERKIDAQTALEEQGTDGPGASVVRRVRDLLNERVERVRANAIRTIERAYWQDINEGGLLAFPRPDIAGAVGRIDESRHDLLAPLAQYVGTMLPLGDAPAAIVARVIFRTVAPEVKVRLYRRLVVRFLAQLGALFVLAALCFYLSILGWARAAPSVFNEGGASAGGVLLYQLDLMLRGALFDFMEHTQRSISPIRLNLGATAFVYYTLLFRTFVSIYVISSLVRVARFVARRWRAFLR